MNKSQDITQGSNSLSNGEGWGEAMSLLKQIIATPSFSKEEHATADIIALFLVNKSISIHRKQNNVWAFNKYFDANKPTILLNSHHDTVKPNAGYRLDPFNPIEKDGKLYGLGSNDAGGALVSLIATFIHFYDQTDLKYNLILAATAEEEISGKNGIESILSEFGVIDFAIIGEPTEMQLAIAEKGLMVLDCITHGKAGHAAREEGENAIYKAFKDIEWFRTHQFPKVSETLGPVKMSVTVIKSGTQHNVVPDKCEFTVDVRTTDAYSNEELLEIIKNSVNCEVTARSTRLNPSSIATLHPIVQAGLSLGRTTYGSPTLSDQALIPVPSLKIGPGHSSRSHSADEFIYVREIVDGIDIYIKLLTQILSFT